MICGQYNFMKQNLLILMLVTTASLAIAGETFIELGQVAMNTPVKHSVAFKNTDSRNAVRIEKVETSCECLRVLNYPTEVAPGASAEIAYELKPDAPGLFGYELTVTPSSGEKQVFVLGVAVPDKTTSRFPILPERKLQPRNQSLYISTAEILAVQAKPAFVDVRSTSEYTQCHIPGALNLPPYFIATKKYLKSSPLVLVDGGWGDSGLEQTAQELKAAGFSQVQILHGGLAAWRAAGGQTEGTMPGLPSLSEISAVDYLRNRNSEVWAVVDLREIASAMLPESLPLAPSGKPEAFIAALSALTQKGPKRILIVDNDGRGYSEVRRVLSGWSGAPVFYLQDGMQGIERQLKLMEASAKSRTETLTTRTASVASKGGGGAAASGVPRKKCGSCPN